MLRPYLLDLFLELYHALTILSDHQPSNNIKFLYQLKILCEEESYLQIKKFESWE